MLMAIEEEFEGGSIRGPLQSGLNKRGISLSQDDHKPCNPNTDAFPQDDETSSGTSGVLVVTLFAGV